MKETEAETRKNRIDTRLVSPLLNWKIIRYRKGLETSTLSGHAVIEYPTSTGPADYALFVEGKLLGVIECKKVTIGVKSEMEHAKRYSKSVDNTIGEWNDYKIPFLYASNGEYIYFLDVRNEKNLAYELSDFHSPQALLDKFNRDTQKAGQWLMKNPANSISILRYYQGEAVDAIEKALIRGKNRMLLTMATGTGKTVTIVSLIYRLLKSGFARRILFLVDRRVLSAQTVSQIASFQTPDGLKLDQVYEVYSQKYKRDDLDSDKNFNPNVLPESYLTHPEENKTFVYVSTIQRMVVNLLGREEAQNLIDYETENLNEDSDAHTFDIPNHAFDVIIADECHRGYSSRQLGPWKKVMDYFDAVKIGLTATPATHTMNMFDYIVYNYGYQQAVEDGYLVDWEAVEIKSDIHINGTFLREGELVDEIDRYTGQKRMYYLEDEREFAAEEIEKKVTAPDSTKKIIQALKYYTDSHESEYGRFPKILIFAVNDLPHVSHADEIVDVCKQVFDRGDDFVVKITGNPNVDRPLQKIREFRNKPNPKIVVTVDMLSTGVDIPSIEMVVFMRPVKSRILWDQMLGRGTRLNPDINKDKFTIVDCFGGTLINYFKQSTELNIEIGNEYLSLPEIIDKIDKNEDREYHTKVLIKRLRRYEKNINSEIADKLSEFISDGDLKQFIDELRHRFQSNFLKTIRLLKNKNFIALIMSISKPKQPFLTGYDIKDTVTHEVLFRVGSNYMRPADYLELFQQFVKKNPEQIEAIEILLSKPAGWNNHVLDQLRHKLKKKDFDEKDLQSAYHQVYQKPLPDIISMVKHAASLQSPIYTASERVENAMEKIIASREFSEEQQRWLEYIKAHIIKTLSLAEEDFKNCPVFERHGGLRKAKIVFGKELQELINRINEAIAA